ncbi:CAP domain-containing protein [Kocuria palustris]|uniref:CAP domain-containing protein n=1 Tax=Kocuria palustris TaxID=71999 RepID=UPI0011A1BB7E|nr:CAP domain-containing protein [Kocuria palustris]
MKKTRLCLAAAALAAAGTGAAVAPAQAAVSVAADEPRAQASAAQAPEPEAAPAVDSSFSAQVSQEVLAQVNDHRAQAGLSPLAGSGELDAMSTGWSGQQAAAGAPSHNPSFIEQTRAAGSTGMAENIAYSMGSQGSVEETASYFVDYWMNSPSHRANIMDPQFNAAGFGLAEGDDGNVYATQNFGTF